MKSVKSQTNVHKYYWHEQIYVLKWIQKEGMKN